MKKKPSASGKKPSGDRALREHVLYLLGGGGAHVGFEKAIAGLPAELRGVKPENLPFTAWGLLEHLRLAQWDIVEFSINSEHVSPEWPSGYWPAGDAPPSDAAWKKSVQQFRRDLQRMQDLVANPRTDLYAPIQHGDGQTVLREALLVADHNAYHLGELVVLRRLLGAWKS
jgi:DinB superfamily